MPGERAAPLSGLSHPRLPPPAAIPEITALESWVTPAIGNPERGFSAPLTFSLDQPSPAVELRVGDFGSSGAGSRQTGHRVRNGFMDSGLGTGYGDRQIDRKPVQIIWKPTPTYTDEARTKQIDGEVILDVMFQANGRAEVLGIVQSLGYGLDDVAVEAVQHIRFRPASVNGRAIDFQGRAHIEFHLLSTPLGHFQ